MGDINTSGTPGDWKGIPFMGCMGDLQGVNGMVPGRDVPGLPPPRQKGGVLNGSYGGSEW
jgi:hypothetical protein